MSLPPDKTSFIDSMVTLSVNLALINPYMKYKYSRYSRSITVFLISFKENRLLFL